MGIAQKYFWRALMETYRSKFEGNSPAKSNWRITMRYPNIVLLQKGRSTPGGRFEQDGTI
jgi:hypothetical protein